jgi:hypothetical protein
MKNVTQVRWRRGALGVLWILAAPDLDVSLKLAAEGSKACHRKVRVRRCPGK